MCVCVCVATCMQEERIKRLVSEHANKLLQQLETLKTETMQKVDAVQADMDR